MGTDFVQKFCPLLASTHFPRVLFVGSGVSGVSQRVSSQIPENVEEENYFSYTLFSDCLAETISKMREFIKDELTILRCCHCNLKVPLVRLTCAALKPNWSHLCQRQNGIDQSRHL